MAVPGTTDFTGTPGAAWPAPWTVVSGSGTIQANRGQQVTPTGTWVAAEHRAGATLGDASVVATLNFSAATNVTQRINLRYNPDTGNGYRLIATPSYSGFQLMRVTGWAETALHERFDIPWTAGTDYKLRFEVSGSTVRARRWTGATEPTTWDLSATDTTYASGDVTLVTVVMDVAASVTGTWDDVAVTALSSGGGGGTTGTTGGMGARDPGRVGFHNDAFLAPFDDYGTYTTFTLLDSAGTRDYTATQTATGLPMMGETAADNPPHSDYDTGGSSELATYHWNVLNPAGWSGNNVVPGWTQAQRDDANRRLGYRLRLTTVSLSATPPVGGTLSVQLTMANDGFARTHRSRPVQLVLVSGATVVSRTLPIDARDVLPGQTLSVSTTVAAPAVRATYTAHLVIDDPSASLAGRGEYAIRLANTETVWDAATGRNGLGMQVDVGGAGAATWVKAGTGAGSGVGAGPKTVTHPATTAKTGAGATGGAASGAKTVVTAATRVKTGAAAAGAGASGAKTVVPAAVWTKTGAASASAAAAGVKAVIRVKTGTGAAGAAAAGVKTVTSAAAAVKTGTGAAGAASSGPRTVTPAAVYGKTGAAAGSAAAAGAKTVTAAATRVKTGAAAAAAAGSGVKTVAPAATRVKAGAGAAGSVGSGTRLVVSAGGYTKTGTAAAGAAGAGPKQKFGAATYVKAGAAVAALAGSGVEAITPAAVRTKTGTAAAIAAAGGSRLITTRWLFAGSATDRGGPWATPTAAVGPTQGDTATWSSAGPGSAVLELGGFGLEQVVPDGAAVASVALRVRTSVSDAAVDTLTAQCYVGATPVGAPTALVRDPVSHDDVITVSGLAYADLPDLRVRITAGRGA